MTQVNEDQKIVEPFNDEQTKFYKKINIQIAKCNGVLKDSFVAMEKDEKLEAMEDENHEECRELVETISKMNEMNDLVHLSIETEKLYKLCDNHKGYFAMHERMSTMLENEIKPALINAKEQMEQLQIFIAEVKAAMKKSFDEHIDKIEKLAAKNGADIEVQYHRLKDFEERNVEDPDNTQNIPHADVLYLKKEIALFEISIAMIVSIKSSILENC